GLDARIGELLQRNGVDHLIAIGPRPMAIAGTGGMRVEHHADAAAMLAAVDPADLAGATVLVKGARAYALEQVVRRWERRVHGTVLEIDLEAIRHNLNHHRMQLRP